MAASTHSRLKEVQMFSTKMLAYDFENFCLVSLKRDCSKRRTTCSRVSPRSSGASKRSARSQRTGGVFLRRAARRRRSYSSRSAERAPY